MKRISLILVLALGMALSVSAQFRCEQMRKFYDAAKDMREAIETKNIGLLKDAEITLMKINMRDFGQEVLDTVGEMSRNSLGKPKVFYTHEFARTLAETPDFQLKAIENAHIMRKGEGIQLWHASIKPGSEATLSYMALDYCEMLLFAMSDDDLELKVYDNNGNMVKCEPIEEKNSAWLAQWDMPKVAAEFKFTIVNNGDKESTFVVAIN